MPRIQECVDGVEYTARLLDFYRSIANTIERYAANGFFVSQVKDGEGEVLEFVMPAKQDKDDKSERLKRLLEMCIEELLLSVRTYNALKRAGFSRLADILSMSESECLRIKNFGRRHLAEIKEMIKSMSAEHGVDLCFGMKLPV